MLNIRLPAGRGRKLKRTATGLLFADDFNRADGAPGANYTVESAAWTIAGNKLHSVGGGVLKVNLAQRKDWYLQVLLTRASANDYGTLFLRRSGTNHYQFDHGATGVDGGLPRLYRKTAGAFTQLGALGAGVGADGVQERFNFSVKNGEQIGYIDGVQQCVAADATVGNDIVGDACLNPNSGTMDWDSLVICTTRLITCSGLPVGWKLKLGAALSGASTGVGVVTLDPAGALLPIVKIDAVDGGGGLRASFTPSGGVFGGDALAYA